MKFYPEDYSVEVIVNFTDLNGAAVTPTAVNAVLYDGEDTVLEDFGSLELMPDATSQTVIVPAALNSLPDGELRAARILRIELVTPAGSIRRAHSYVIESEQRLEIMTNTFQSYEAAEIQALDVPNVTGWLTASEDQRKAALVEAFRRVTQIPMKFTIYGPNSALSSTGWRPDWNSVAPREILEEQIITRDGWEEVTAELYSGFPTKFKKALRRAQFMEANEMLQGDTVGQKHRSGIVTETIGESSVTLRAGRVDYGVSSQTLQALVGHVYFNMRTVRA
ncbi:hypothetical protein [Agrobacterium sp. CG674]